MQAGISRRGALALGVLFSLTGWAAPAPEGTVVVITPHTEAIRTEFGAGFARWHRQQFGHEARVDWRELGGTSDALKFVLSEFAKKPEGIGIDCFFGGGLEPFLTLEDKELLAVHRPPAELLAAIPRTFNGIEVYDEGYAWFGAALSSFGILQSTRVQQQVGLPFVRRWEDLAAPELLGWVGAGDPRNSGSMNVMFESILQAYGWERGWALITRLGGNIRKFDRVSANTAKDTTLGETAYAMAVDFYGFAQVAAAGRSNLSFVLPNDFTAINPDGIALLKAGPNPEAARRFINFVLGEPGQKLWLLQRGHPEGPQQYSIERMPVRPDLYERYRAVSNIEFSPFALRQSFTYDARLGRARREIVAALVGALLVDTHPELQAAWRAVIQRGQPPAQIARLTEVPLTEAEALNLAGSGWKQAAVRNAKKIEWQRWALAKYRELVQPVARR